MHSSTGAAARESLSRGRPDGLTSHAFHAYFSASPVCARCCYNNKNSRFKTQTRQRTMVAGFVCFWRRRDGFRFRERKRNRRRLCDLHHDTHASNSRNNRMKPQGTHQVSGGRTVLHTGCDLQNSVREGSATAAMELRANVSASIYRDGPKFWTH